jgi:hypothetical protein
LLAGELPDAATNLMKAKWPEKGLCGEGLTVASVPQGTPQMAINRNPDQLFHFAFRSEQR